jgi:hypothetical protein
MTGYITVDPFAASQHERDIGAPVRAIKNFFVRCTIGPVRGAAWDFAASGDKPFNNFSNPGIFRLDSRSPRRLRFFRPVGE